MAASGQASLKSEVVPRCKSEGNLLDEQNFFTHYDMEGAAEDRLPRLSYASNTGDCDSDFSCQTGERLEGAGGKVVRLTKQQIEAYEIPHQGRTGEVITEMMWKPAYDFLYTWGAHYGESYRDVLQDLQLALDRMKNPVTKHWRELTGALILVNCLDILRATSFHVSEED